MDARSRIALVTGTSSGIGAALTDALLSQDWAVLGLSRRSAVFDSPHYRHLECDLADFSALDALVEKELFPIFSDACWDRVGLVNNSAHIGSLRAVTETELSTLAQVLAVNSVAPIFLMGFMIRSVPPENSLRIVNVSSGAAVQGIPGLADYCASKAALRIAGEAAGAELSAAENGSDPRDVAILSYEPGIVDTSMQEKARAESPDDFPSQELFQGFSERGELQSPDAVAASVVEFLASEGGEPFVEQRYGRS